MQPMTEFSPFQPTQGSARHRIARRASQLSGRLKKALIMLGFFIWVSFYDEYARALTALSSTQICHGVMVYCGEGRADGVYRH